MQSDTDVIIIWHACYDQQKADDNDNNQPPPMMEQLALVVATVMEYV